MKVITPPETLVDDVSKVSIFLGGTIDMGNSIDWQSKFCSAFKENDEIILYNPRRVVFESKDIKEQILWERKAQNLAVFKVYNFEPGSASPITFLELGEYGNSKDTFVRCCKSFYRYENIKIFCAELNIPLFDTLEQIIEAIQKRLVT